MSSIPKPITAAAVEASVAHLTLLVNAADEARQAALNMHNILGHCAVELAMERKMPSPFRGWAPDPIIEAERARLFALWHAGRLVVSVGGGGVAIEEKPEKKGGGS